MLIPFKEINPQTLDALLEAHALQEGTEYGDQEISLASKISQLKLQLEKGQVCIVYDAVTESCNLVTKQRWQELSQQSE